MLHPLGILLRSENANCVVVGSSGRLHAFIALHSVIETGSHAVQAKERIRNEGGRSPLSRRLAPGGLDMAIHFTHAEANVVPVLEEESALMPLKQCEWGGHRPMVLTGGGGNVMVL